MQGADAQLTISDLEQRKQQLADELEKLEQSIYDMETQYMEETSYGNIVKGWDGFLALKLKNLAPKRNYKVPPKERVFSGSSTTNPGAGAGFL